MALRCVPRLVSRAPGGRCAPSDCAGCPEACPQWRREMSDEIGRREFLKRGTVAGVIATGIPVSTALGTKQPAGGATPNSSTPHAEPHARELAARRMDSKEFCLSEFDAITPTLSFKAKT